jgi:hypothetical protein
VNEQEAFNEIWDHFIVKGSPPGAQPGRSSCRLRTTDGKCCHLGKLIPDEQYSFDLEIAAPYTRRLKELTPVLQALSDGFLSRLRFAHDQAAAESTHNLASFTKADERNLRELAANFNLTIPASSPQMGQEKTSCPSIA